MCLNCCQPAILHCSPSSQFRNRKRFSYHTARTIKKTQAISTVVTLKWTLKVTQGTAVCKHSWGNVDAASEVSIHGAIKLRKQRLPSCYRSVALKWWRPDARPDLSTIRSSAHAKTRGNAVEGGNLHWFFLGRRYQPVQMVENYVH